MASVFISGEGNSFMLRLSKNVKSLEKCVLEVGIVTMMNRKWSKILPNRSNPTIC